MAYKISDECLSCGACAGECPQGAISEGSSHFQIDPEKCVSCGLCASVCPAGAISEE
ncbi:4Fe-4S binding protein [bacterium]|nr:4Fe-4S binding protein [bacterium]